MTRGSATDSPDVEALARAATAGDADAFDALVRAVHGRVHRWAFAHVDDSDEADDVAQRVLVRLYRHLDRWKGRGRFTSWLYRVTTNEAKSWRSKARRVRTLARDWGVDRPTALTPAPLEALDRARLVRRARAQFRRLPPRQREVIDLVDFQGYQPAEAAGMLDLNPNTLRANLLKARRSLRHRLLAGVDPVFEGGAAGEIGEESS